MNRAEPTLLDRIAVVADPLRARILLSLEERELAVAELSSVFQLPQSSMSRHLKALMEEGWLIYRSEGTSRRYTMARQRLAPEVRELWELLRSEVVELAAGARDEERVQAVLSDRRSRSQEFFLAAAGEWDRIRSELIGQRLDALALLGLLDPSWVVGDLGCGTGSITEMLAPFVGRVVGIDESERMLEVAARRVAGESNVELRRGDVTRLPIETGTLDAAVLFLVLQHQGDPLASLREGVRALRAGGRLLVVDLVPHDREEYRQRFGHVWLGFEPDRVRTWMEEVGLGDVRYVELAPAAEAKGPPLFGASGRKVHDPATPTHE